MEDTNYDIIIVGSGLGGLECGAILSREGYKVLVLEKNKQIGGNLQIFSREKRIFDTGIHYIGGLEPGQNLYHYLRYLGIMDDLKIKKLDEDGFDIVTFEGDDTEYKYAQGYERHIEVLASYFPEERDNIVKYCNAIREVCSNFPMYNLKSSVGATPVTFHNKSAKDFIASCTSNKKLQAVLGGTNALYAGVADKTPLYTHALIINSYIESSYRCIDGGSQIAILLSRLIRQNGGKILKHAEVKKFTFAGDRISGVEMADGQRFEAKNFISNIHPQVTLDMVEEGYLRKAYRKRIASLENSISVFIVYLVLKKGTMKYFNRNYYHFIDHDVWAGTEYTKENWPMSYALFTGASSKDNEYTDAITVMAYMKYEEMQKWADTYNIVSKEQERGADYENFKREKAEKLIDALAKNMPDIRNKIESYYTSTPLTYRDYIGTPDGSLYGITKDYKDPMKSFISPRTKIKNLLLTGQNLNMHGVLGVTIGAMVTCSEFLGNEYIMEQVRKA